MAQSTRKSVPYMINCSLQLEIGGCETTSAHVVMISNIHAEAVNVAPSNLIARLEISW